MAHVQLGQACDGAGDGLCVGIAVGDAEGYAEGAACMHTNMSMERGSRVASSASFQSYRLSWLTLR